MAYRIVIGEQGWAIKAFRVNVRDLKRFTTTLDKVEAYGLKEAKKRGFRKCDIKTMVWDGREFIDERELTF